MYIIRGSQYDDEKGTLEWYKAQAIDNTMDLVAVLISLAVQFLMLSMYVRFSKSQHKANFDRKFLNEVQEAYKEKLLHNEAERRYKNNIDAAQRILDESVKQVFMACV